jgi:hypothetical protein
MSKIKIGITYICTGKYNIFWDKFYKSAEKYLFTDTKFEKHYFVITTYDINTYSNNNIKVIKQPEEVYPYATLKKFYYMLLFENELKDMDYIYYFNSNSIFANYVDTDILPDDNSQIVVMKHPFLSIYLIDNGYERNPKSTAYIPEGNKTLKYYCCGGIIGGHSKEFLPALREMENNIEIDLKNNIVAKWHDESHLNKYMLTHPYKMIMSPGYCYMEMYKKYIYVEKYDIKIIIADKNKYGGGLYLRNDTKENRQLKRKFFDIR